MFSPSGADDHTRTFALVKAEIREIYARKFAPQAGSLAKMAHGLLMEGELEIDRILARIEDGQGNVHRRAGFH